MPRFDLSLLELRDYHPQVAEPADFDEFWRYTLAEARRATAPALFSVGLLDPVSPPSTVFAAFNRYAGDAEIEVYPFNQHEGGGGHHGVRQAAWLERRMG